MYVCCRSCVCCRYVGRCVGCRLCGIGNVWVVGIVL
jgi:hypothetical protein